MLTGCEHGAQVRHGVGRGSAVRLTAEGAALCATPCEAEQRGPDIMCIIRIKPLGVGEVNAGSCPAQCV
ncbi:hypothetical protein [Xenorhabdus szentirmaii]|uniref:hypothetical protein n=1 Tax=Xenorhabdus szentirmaii TaxID=290112 RepID=UPI0011454BB7|nr:MULTISPECIES: hypothetical protein [Xenorhabdus]MBD2806520.1 hypothetical protein [Xenorhabdus sp. ZM]MBD2821842.1 hypothetical protein [Xenorhabdus sp. 42]